MLEPFVVEVWGKPAGIVVRQGDLFRFHAVASPFFELDGTEYSTPGHARLAAARLGNDDQAAASGVSFGRARH